MGARLFGPGPVGAWARILVASVVVSSLVVVELQAQPAATQGGPASAWACTARWGPEPLSAGDLFGSAVAVRGDRLYVGAPGDDDAGPDAGAVYVLDRGSGMVLAKLLSPDPQASNGFGGSVLIAADHLVVASFNDWYDVWRTNEVFVFEPDTLRLTGSVPGAQGEGQYHPRVTISADGGRFAVASPFPYDEAGSVGARVYDAGTLDRVASFAGHFIDEQTVDGFPYYGDDVLLYGDHLYVGHTHKTASRGMVHHYSIGAEAELPPVAQPSTLHFGRGLARDDARLFVASSGSGHLWAYDAATSAPLWDRGRVMDSDPEFGMTLGRIGPWLTAANAAPDGWAYHNVVPRAALNLLDPVDGSLLHRLEPKDPVDRSGFGWASTGDAGRIFIGAPSDAKALDDAGAVYVFEPRPSGALGCWDGVRAPGCDDLEDFDGDGVLANDERRSGTDPCHADSDGDGLRDGHERQYGSDPLVRDTDGDGLDDWQETRHQGTDPTDPDTDGDLFSDGHEVTLGSDPRDPTSTPLPLPPPLA